MAANARTSRPVSRSSSVERPTPLETDELWALLSPELYILLVNEAGWTPAAYESWVATTLERVVPRS